jgi:hypothetical protein
MGLDPRAKRSMPRFQGQVARTLDYPLVALLEEHGIDESEIAPFVREDTGNVGSAFGLVIEALQRIGREAHDRERVRLDVIHKGPRA